MQRWAGADNKYRQKFVNYQESKHKSLRSILSIIYKLNKILYTILFAIK